MALLTTIALIGAGVAAAGGAAKIGIGASRASKAKKREDAARSQLEGIDKRDRNIDAFASEIQRQGSAMVGDIKSQRDKSELEFDRERIAIRSLGKDFAQRSKQLRTGAASREALGQMRRTFKEGAKGLGVGALSQLMRRSTAATSGILAQDRQAELGLTQQQLAATQASAAVTGQKAQFGLGSLGAEAGVRAQTLGLQSTLEQAQSQRELDLTMYPIVSDLGQAAQMRQSGQAMMMGGISDIAGAGIKVATAGLGGGDGAEGLMRDPVTGAKSSYGGTYPATPWSEVI